MHGPTLARLILAASILSVGGAAPAPISQRLADARRSLASSQPTTAISTLEQALADPALAAKSADKFAILDLLMQSYEAAAAQAVAAGRTREADGYRENARILGRKPGKPGNPVPTISAPVATPAALGISPLPEPPTPAPQALVEMPAPTTPIETLNDHFAAFDQAAAAAPVPLVAPEPDRLPEPSPATPAPIPDPAAVLAPRGPGLSEADAAFRATKYDEAGQIYGTLARNRQLPADRVEHWAYCRSAVVAKRIAAKPKSEAEWQSINAEIDQIRALAPMNWLGEYLRNAAAARPTASKVARSGSTVVRAASPEEPPARSGRGARSVPTPTTNQAPAPAPNPIRVDTPMLTDPGGTPGGPVGRWRVRESENFRVFHANPELAEQVAQIAENVRHEGIKRWSGQIPGSKWTPRCDIYLFPNAPQYAQMTGQPADSPGFSTMGMNQGQITSRRVNVRTDHAGLLAAVLPHEITHVILADFFTEQQIPRWADEGMAVLMEPGHEQKRRANDLVDPLGRNLLFPIETLMKMDYPDERYWTLYYAQSVSLTRFLVEQGSPSQFVRFLQGAQANGFEPELKRIYKINDFTDLQARWVDYARNAIETDAASANATVANEAKPNRRSR